MDFLIFGILDLRWLITHRLGYVYGRLKGYEREEDLVSLVRKIKEQDKPVMETKDGPIY